MSVHSPVLAIFERAAREQLSHRMSTAVRVFNSAVVGAGFGLFARALGDAERSGLDLQGAPDYVSFVMIGWLVQNFVWSMQGAITAQIGSRSFMGLLTSPCSLVQIIAGLTLFPVCWLLVESAAIFLVARLGFGLKLQLDFSIVLVVLAAILVVLSFDLISSSILLVVKGQTEPISWLLQTSGLVFAGTLFPVEMFPGWLQTLVRAHPQYHVNALARFSMGGGSFTELLPHLLGFALAGGGLLLLGVAAFRTGLRVARQQGTVGHA